MLEIFDLTRDWVTGHPAEGEALDSTGLSAWIRDQYLEFKQRTVLLTELSIAGQLAVRLGKKTTVPTTVWLPPMATSMVTSPVPSRATLVKAGRGIDQNLPRFFTINPAKSSRILNLCTTCIMYIVHRSLQDLTA